MMITGPWPALQPWTSRLRLPSSFLSKKGSPGREASSIIRNCRAVRNSGYPAECTSWRRGGSNGLLSMAFRCDCATLQAWLRSRKFFCTSLHRTGFLVTKTWWRWSISSSSPAPLELPRARMDSLVHGAPSPLRSSLHSMAGKDLRRLCLWRRWKEENEEEAITASSEPSPELSLPEITSK